MRACPLGNTSVRLAIGALSLAMSSVSALAYTEDTGTQLTVGGVKAHVCANNQPMVGVDAGNNIFLCSNAVGVAATSKWIADKTTHQTFEVDGKKVSIHVCPTGDVMMGWNKAENVLICASIEPPPPAIPPNTAGSYLSVKTDSGKNETKIKEPSSGHTVHGCDAAGNMPVMAGIKDDENILVCGSVLFGENIK